MTYSYVPGLLMLVRLEDEMPVKAEPTVTQSLAPDTGRKP